MSGIVAVLVAVSLLSFSDALVKLSGDSFGLAQLILLRSAVAAILLAIWLLPLFGLSGLRLVRPGWVWARSLCLSAMWLSYYSALPYMSFALAAACYYTAPAWMALLSRVLLGMKIGGRGWSAIALSLAGVLLVVSPSPDSVTPVLLLPLTAAAFYALAGIITWSKCQADSPSAMAFTLNICLCVVSGLGLLVLSFHQPTDTESFVLSTWPRLTRGDWSLVILLGALLAVIATAVAMAYRLAPTPVVGVFDTAYLGAAAIWGVLFFGEVPSVTEGLGMVLIAGGAALMSVRQRSKFSMSFRYTREAAPRLPAGRPTSHFTR
ncbi:DMT family transporter [Palleronia sp. LCG004]|uniref:DMT family transporter n=1 Tax=Palleronia sp. LCG004 TaxID=3079304 RepID=UPI002942E3BE|nr:DMT family transporter [Palleronia sp. LCG004]WOI57206.1 DMT family transporter [Palleronia sp. LCG004]